MKMQGISRNYECSYQHNCPHLEGLSTQWVFDEYQRSHDEHIEHWRVGDILEDDIEEANKRIDKLESENEELKAKLKALHKRQFKSNTKRNRKSPDKSGAEEPVNPKQKKRGAPQGHPGWFRREPDHIDKVVDVKAPEKCPRCSSSNLIAMEEVKEHLQEDIILQPKTYVTNFKHHQAFCPKCKRAVIKNAAGELNNCHIGPTTRAAALFLRYGLRVPYRKVQELFKVLFNMPFVPASAMAFDRQATKKGEPLYQDLKEKLRSSKVALSIFGDSFDGILNTDGYAAYNAVNPRGRQSCLAHLIRKAEEIKQEILLKRIKHQDKKSLLFCESISNLLRKACKIAHKFNIEEIHRSRSEIFKHYFYSALHSMCTGVFTNQKVNTLKVRLLDPNKEYNRLFTFLDYENVQPTNNQAEQSLRNMVIRP